MFEARHLYLGKNIKSAAKKDWIWHTNPIRIFYELKANSVCNKTLDNIKDKRNEHIYLLAPHKSLHWVLGVSLHFPR